MPTEFFNSNKIMKLPESIKWYLYVQIYRENSWAVQCAKLRALTKVVDSILEIE